MKVYELVAVLMECPAGAEVEFCALKTIEQFSRYQVTNDVGGKDAYEICEQVKEAVPDGEEKIVLYA